MFTRDFTLTADDSTIVSHLVVPPRQVRMMATMDLHDFITENTVNFFYRFEISQEFLLKDPSEWSADEQYVNAKKN